jgi:hypothetical protein
MKYQPMCLYTLNIWMKISQESSNAVNIYTKKYLLKSSQPKVPIPCKHISVNAFKTPCHYFNLQFLYLQFHQFLELGSLSL